MGCFNCFKSKVGEDDSEPSKLRENVSSQLPNEEPAGKTLVPKQSNEPTVEEVEHSRERTQELHSSQSRSSSPIITRDFGAVATDPASTSKNVSPAKSSPPATVLSPATTNEHDDSANPKSPRTRSDGALPPRSTSLESRSKSQSGSQSPTLKEEENKAEKSDQDHETTDTLPINTTSDADEEPLAGEENEDTKGAPKLDIVTEKEGAASDAEVAAKIPLPASPTTPTSPTLPSLSTSVPSVSDRKSPSTLAPPSIDDPILCRSSQDSSSLLPNDFLAEEDKPKIVATVLQAPTPPPTKSPSPKTPSLIIPQPSSSSKLTGQKISMDAPTPTSASSTTRPDNLLRTSTAPSPVATSPNTKENKRKSRLSRFMSTGGVNKRKSQAMPAAKDLKTIEDMPPTPKYIPTAVPNEKKHVRDVNIDEKEMQQKELELETPATVDSVTGRTWKDDGDNDSLFCY